jgi:hypothetical protein
MRRRLTTRLALGAALLLPAGAGAASFDVIVYGGTPGGIAAAVAAARHGHTVALIEPTRHVGGLVTSGLSHTDFRTFEGITGTFLEFNQRVERHYREKYGSDSPQAQGCFRGTHAEPHVNELVFEQMLAEPRTIKVFKGRSLAGVDAAKVRGGLRRLRTATFTGEDGNRETFAARVFIDGTYEGDLMAMAGVNYRVGREARSEYGESLAPEEADTRVQGYNFRFIMTTNAANRVMPVAPPGYDRAEFVDVLPLLGKQIRRVFAYTTDSIYKAQLPGLPNDKVDINDVSRSPVRLSMPGHNDDWPDGDTATRARIFAEHVRYNVGLLWFLQNDEAVPAPFRDDARQWGWCRDEFTDNGHLPWQLYVREARRMTGRHVFTERDTDPAPNDVRSVLHRDAIAVGDYGENCHGTGHEGPRYGGRHTGEFYKSVSPYQVPYGVLVPNEVENLLVPVAASSSHVGFCALRLEPIWTSLGQAAGHAAHLALKEKTAVQKVSVPRLQRLLHAEGSATIYVSDVPPGAPLFAAVQWLATQGGLHGLAPAGLKHGQRGKNIVGQYFEAYPGHEFQPDEPVTAELAEKWLALLDARLRSRLAKDAQFKPDGRLTRGTFAARLHERVRD